MIKEDVVSIGSEAGILVQEGPDLIQRRPEFLRDAIHRHALAKYKYYIFLVRVVRDIAALLRPVPLVLCLDQLEALQSYPGDKTGLFAIGNLMAALHDELPNAVVIGCVQTGLIDELRRATIIRQDRRDRRC